MQEQCEAWKRVVPTPHVHVCVCRPVICQLRMPTCTRLHAITARRDQLLGRRRIARCTRVEGSPHQDITSNPPFQIYLHSGRCGLAGQSGRWSAGDAARASVARRHSRDTRLFTEVSAVQLRNAGCERGSEDDQIFTGRAAGMQPAAACMNAWAVKAMQAQRCLAQCHACYSAAVNRGSCGSGRWSRPFRRFCVDSDNAVACILLIHLRAGLEPVDRMSLLRIEATSGRPPG